MLRNRVGGRSAFDRFRDSVLAVLIVMSSSGPLWAQSPKKSDLQESNSEAGDELHRGPIEVSNALLRAKVVSEKGALIGEIVDLLLDLEQGHLSTVVIARQGTQEGKSQQFAIPWSGLHRNKENVFEIRCTKEKISLAPELDPKLEVESMTRQWAKTVYDHFGIKERTIEGEKPKTSDDYPLTRATSLENVRVNNLMGTKLGHLSGFAVSASDGLIVYAALSVTQSAQGMQAIPLSAFIVKPSQTEWLLDISEEALAERPGFRKSAWPTAIDRGWSEYVHVLYGRTVFEGVRSAPKSVTAKP